MRRPFHPAALLVALAIGAAAPPAARAQDDPRWDNRFSYPGTNGTVRASAWYRGDLYIAGDFTEAGGIPVNYIARWDGQGWHALRSGISAGPVTPVVAALAVYDDALIVGGFFSRADTAQAFSIARWDGSEWSEFGEGIGGEVDAILPVGNDLYVGGTFTTTGRIAARRVARWDGSQWHALGEGIGTVNNDARVHALAHDGTYLYAGGDIRLAGGVAVDNIARWDGAAWSALGEGADATVYSLALFDGELYAGGRFTELGGEVIPRLGRWANEAWNTSGIVVGSAVRALAAHDGALYVGGLFSTVDVAGPNVARYDGSVWSTIDFGISAEVYTLAPADGGVLAAAGNFGSAGFRFAHSVTVFDGASWRALGQGVEGRVRAIQPVEGGYYVGGEFTAAGGVPALNIAFWDGDSWSPVGSGIDGFVNTFAVIGGLLYVGGDFSHAGDVEVLNVAVWDGGAWSPVGPGLGGPCRVLVADDQGFLYAGGSFNNAGATPVGRVARWDGDVWAPVGGGIPSPGVVNAIVIDGGSVYIGGVFERAGGVDAANIARYFDGLWFPVGLGTNGPVHALALSPSGLYAAGDFVRAGGQDANGIARWDGAGWNADFSAGISHRPVTALHAQGADSLYMGGAFESILGEPAPHVALWDGFAWNPLGDGVDGEVNTLLRHGDDLLVGGAFNRAGTFASHNVARWNPGGAVPVTLLSLRADRGDAGVELAWTVADPEGDLLGFHVVRENPGGARERITAEPLFGGADYRYVDRDAPAGATRYWLRALTRAGEAAWFGPVTAAAAPPVRLLAARPNPFRGATAITYRLEQAGPVRVEVFDLAGRLVRVVDDGIRAAGEQRVVWDGRDDRGLPAGSGVFFARVATPGWSLTRRLVALP